MNAVLVTGAGGFLGHHVVDALRTRVERTIALGSSLSASESEPLRTVRGSTRSAKHLTEILRQEPVRCILHLAAHPDAGLDAAIAARILRVNVAGALRVLEAARRAPGTPPRVVLASSIKVYGAGAVPLRESTPLDPTSPYAIAKVAADQLGMLYHRERGVPCVSLRLTQAYGPHQPGAMLFRQLLDAGSRGESLPMTAGEQTRDLLFASDIAQAFVQAIDAPDAPGHVINIGSGTELSMRELATRVHAQLPGAPAPSFGALPYRGGEIFRQVVDPTTARDLLGFSPSTSLDEGIRQTIGWLRGSGLTAKGAASAA